MDYEQKYKEALKRADSLTEKYGGRDFAEYVFPELAEDEDERIRQALIGYLEGSGDVAIIPGIKVSDAIAYLKKQKEQKPISWTELTWKDIVELEGIINNVHYEFRNGIGQESFGKEVLEKFREYKGDEYLDEIEQKPAEWSEEDEKMLRTIISDGSRGVELDSKQISWLKSLKPQARWKPSEEQMNELWATLIPEYEFDCDILQGLYYDLKKLM